MDGYSPRPRPGRFALWNLDCPTRSPPSTATSTPQPPPWRRCCPIWTTSGATAWSSAEFPRSRPTAIRPRAPISARPQWRGQQRRARTRRLGQLTAQVFGRWQAQRAICNCLYGVELLFSEDMAAAFARALNDWIAKEWLDRDPRLRASIVVPTQNIEFAVDEIERCAKDRRFVQILAAGHAGKPARAPALVADLRGGRTPRPADRHPSGLDLSAFPHVARVADLLHRGLCELRPGLPVAAGEPDLRRACSRSFPISRSCCSNWA